MISLFFEEDKEKYPIPLTYECNLNCPFCATSNIKKEYSLDEIKNKIIFAHENKKQVILTGGEPLKSKYFVEVLKYVEELKIDTIIETNAILLSNEKIAKFFFSIIPSNAKLDILIEGYNGEMHDFLTGKKSFGVLKKVLLSLRQNNIPFATHTVVVKSNYRFLDKIARLLVSFNTTYHRFIFSMPLGTAKENFDSMIPFASMVSEHIEEAVQILKKYNIPSHVEGMPPCFFSPSVKSKLEISSLDLRLEKGHSKQCEDCILKDKCEGFYKWYFDRKSNDDLQPILS